MASRVLRPLAWGLLLIVALAAALAAWLASSDTALQWAIARAERASGGRLAVERARRTGMAAFDAALIRYGDGQGFVVEATGVSVDFSLASVLRMQPRATRLAAAKVRIVAGSARDEPPALPASLRLPFPFEAASVRVGELVVERAGAPLAIRDIDFGLAYDGRRYALTLGGVQYGVVSLEGRLVLDDAAPYALSGSLRAQHGIEGVGPIEIALAGSLEAIGIGAVAPVHGRPLTASIALLPFGPDVVALVEARIAGIDSRRLRPALPEARIDASVRARIRRDGRVAGDLHAVNTLPGMPAAGRLPLLSLATAFAGEGAQWRLDGLVLDAGRAGTLSGSASVASDRIEADLRAQGLDLKGIHSPLHSTSLTGPLNVRWDGRRASVEGRLRQRQGGEIVLDVAYDAGRLDVTHVRWTSAAGTIEARGTANLAAPYSFAATGRLADVDPARLGDYPPARLNATFSARGETQPLSVAVEARIAGSRFRKLQLAGGGRLRYTPERVRDVELELRVGTATVRASGAFGGAGDRMAWDANVPDAGGLVPGAAGSVNANGILTGTWRDPAGSLDLVAARVQWGENVRAARVTARASLSQGLDGRIEARLDAEGMRRGEMSVDRARLVLDGTRARHEARLDARVAAHDVQAVVAGGQTGPGAWRGSIEKLDVAGAFPARLAAPVALSVAPQDVRVGPGRLELGAGRIELARAEWSRSGGWSTRGAIASLGLGALQPLLPVPEALRTLTIAGEWDIAAGETLAGRIALRREAGDIVVPGSPPLPARLAALTVEAGARGAELTWRAAIDSDSFGRATLAGSTRAERRNGQWGVPGDAPLTAALEAVMPSLAWARPLLGDAATIQGAAEASVRVSGSIAQPVFAGRVQGRALNVRVPEFGLVLADGVLDASLAGRQLSIERFQFASGAGRVSGTGSVSLVPGKLAARLGLTAAQLPVLSRPDRLAIVSGRLEVTADAAQVRATGRLRADRGLIELPREDVPRPSTDVVVIGAKPAVRRDLDVHADLQLDLGDDFTVRGRGLSTRLGGTLRAQVTPERGIVLTGAVRAIDGEYTAFGQRLAIQRGVLTFAGPAENPALDILAVRKMPAVEVGVAVGGTALLPQVRLVSTPPMSDGDKLAWLTLGHGLDRAGRNEAAVLQAASLALLSRGSADSSRGTLASRFGLDELSLGTASGTGERVVSVGKRIASDFYVGFERGITGAVSVIKITYDLSRRWSVQARAGSENAVDLFYTLGFR